ncbi:MAG: cytochrome c [Campylobacterota bacterium]|nr:cytochrome c [Campylobacterota bacterium]
MENSLRYLFIVVFIIASSLNLNAIRNSEHIAKEKIGQEYYLKRCSACHGPGRIGGNTNSTQEWKDNFAFDGAVLVELHLEEENMDEFNMYMKSNDFKLEKRRMLRFLQEFAYDSELIPTCY